MALLAVPPGQLVIRSVSSSDDTLLMSLIDDILNMSAYDDIYV
jgi:hypothetical protein